MECAILGHFWARWRCAAQRARRGGAARSRRRDVRRRAGAKCGAARSRRRDVRGRDVRGRAGAKCGAGLALD